MRETRKVVTVLFSDISGSVAIGERMDPESVRRIMSRYFEEMKLVLERHGGTVEKFIGDAVMAVFGVPQAHEDDALRAVRAAVEMREALERLNQELEPTWGVNIVTRTGVNTGEVVAGDPSLGQSFVVGDSVNVAARLEQVAAPGTILIGESTHRLVEDAVTAEGVEPLAVKGKGDPIPAWQVVEVAPATPGWSRRMDSPLVGRDQELASLDALLGEVLESPQCRVVTVMGVAGVGKSRLTEQFVLRVAGRATVIRGRCLPYGEGITFWPVLETIRDATGISAQDSVEEAGTRLSQLLAGTADAEAVRERVAALLGLGEPAPAIKEIFWGVRRLFESLAARLPLVVMFDDVHWGEPTFLDLLEYLASGIRAAPVLLVCIARPELLEARPDWMKGRTNTAMIQLEPLHTEEMDRLIRNLLGGSELEAEARRRIEEVAEGNPLFVEETMRMLVDEGALHPVNNHWEAAGDLSGIQIPPTIQTLLAARLDRLDQEERAVIERASVVGRVFWWDAVSALASEGPDPGMAGQLQSLMRKELVRPDFSDLRMGDSYRFSHILIRDAAYSGLPKATRAELHQRLAVWIVEITGDRPAEYEEILGYHLEQAHRALVELGMSGEEVRELGRRAAVPLASAGLRAFGRGDMPAAVKLLSRAESLRPAEDPERLELLPTLSFALMETGDFGRLQEVVGEAMEAAAASDDPRLQANVSIVGLWIRLFTNPEGWADEARKEATRVIETFRKLGDERGQAKGWSVLGLVHTMKAEFEQAEGAWEQAAEFARRAGDRRDELDSVAWLPLTTWAGPAGPDEARGRNERVHSRAGGDKKATAATLFMQAPFEAGLGNTDAARDLLARARAMLEEVELTVWLAGPLAQVAGWVELTAGDAEAAERELRWGYDTLQQIGDVAFLSTTVAILAEAVCRLGRYEEAEELTGISEQTAAPDDVYSQVLWRSVRAKVLARRGQEEEAERLAREAVDMSEPSDFLHLRAHAYRSLGEVLWLAGGTEGAAQAIEGAINLFRRKGNEVEAQREATRLEQIRSGQAI
jgi:class 3 adenylate cyclase/tetratricopeptide (TPR) repeat protein